ncbi:MAG: cyclic pyranopterin monophosphate synthase MoaC [Burkholderiaceae bacterium]
MLVSLRQAPAPPMTDPHLTHFDALGQAHMVDVADKPTTRRRAVATGKIHMRPEALQAILQGNSRKGDVLGVARLAAINGAKKTAELVLLCHPLSLTRIAVDFTVDAAARAIECRCTVEATGPTGVEMEALTGVQIGLLNIYDMLKAVDRSMRMDDVRLLEKRGGASGDWLAENRAPDA